MQKLRTIFLALWCTTGTWLTAATPPWPPADAEAIANWRAKRFGMFIHWGPVSLTGREIGWSRGDQTPIEVYDDLYRQFNPTNFNADDWVGVAKAAGMKYLILTTKHHDGFCLWDTKLTDFNIMNSPFHRDVVRELSAACKRQGLPFGTYYSTCDWHHPDFPLTSPGGKVKREKSDLDAYNRYFLGQVSELITNYGPLFTMWNDVPQLFKGRGAETIQLVRRLQPDITINNRTGDGGDYDTPEQRVGKFQVDRPWETCMTLCHQWAWKPNDEMKSLAQCVQTLVACAGGDGNLLFNVGPMSDGRIEPRQVARLKEIGGWLSENGDSIYGTRGGPWKPTRALASTRKDQFVFLHVLRLDREAVELPALPAKIHSASLLGGGKVKVSQRKGKLTVNFPERARDPIDTIVRLELDRSAMGLPVIPVATTEVEASASNVYRQQTETHGPQQAFDGDPATRWATDAETKTAWIAADFGKAKVIRGVRIDEAIEKRVAAFELQYRQGHSWKTIFTGRNIGANFVRTFRPVKAREFRLNILTATEGPTLNEVEFLEK